MSRDLIQLRPEDNILIAIRTLEAGSIIAIGESAIQLTQTINLGHKIAAHTIHKGEKIIKYGAPIGSATQTIALGEHVHLHNMRSDYLPTYERGEGTAS